jgi:hypothetical protein
MREMLESYIILEMSSLDNFDKRVLKISQPNCDVRSLSDIIGSLGRDGSFSAWNKRVRGSFRDAIWLDRAHASICVSDDEVVTLSGSRGLRIVLGLTRDSDRRFAVGMEWLSIILFRVCRYL